jgi:hypothetical protein
VRYPSTGRRKAFRVVAWIMAASAVGFGMFMVAGIFPESQRIHALHNAIVGALLLVVSAPAAIAAAWRPERATGPLVHLTAVGLAGLLTMGLALTVDPFTLPFVVLVGVLWFLHSGTEPAFPAGRPSWLLLTLVVASAVPLAVFALDHAELQRLDQSSEHAEFFHWVELSFYAAAILFLGLLAALRPAAYRLSAWSAGTAAAVLGAMSLAFPGRASALDTDWAWTALGGGILFLAVAEWKRRRPSAGRGD